MARKFGVSSQQPFVITSSPKMMNAVDRVRRTPTTKVGSRTEVLSFAMEATDDFGVNEIGMEWIGIEDPSRNLTQSTGETLSRRQARADKPTSCRYVLS